MDERRLSVAAAARRLGVAPATLRTWDRRYGIGPSDHAPGQHRRYAPDDMARLELMQHALVRGSTPADAARFARSAPLPGTDAAEPVGAVEMPEPAVRPDGPRTVDRADRRGDGDEGDGDEGDSDEGDSDEGVGDGDEGRDDRDEGRHGGEGDRDGGRVVRVRLGGSVLRLPGAGPRARGLGRAALAMDAAAVRVLLAESVAESGVEATWEDIARPVLTAVGQRWAETGAGVEIEHLLSECVTAVFGLHAATVEVADIRPVLLAGMPGEQHTLPMVVLAAVLADRGVPCRPLGPNLPVVALVAAIRRLAPAAVVLWAQLPAAADVEVLRALPRTRLRFRIYAAGPGWRGQPMPPLVGYLDSLNTAGATISAAVPV